MWLSAGCCSIIWTITPSWHLNHQTHSQTCPCCMCTPSKKRSSSRCQQPSRYSRMGHSLKLWTCILRAHKRGGRTRNLASTIIKRTNARRDDDEADVHSSFIHPLRDPTFSKLAAVSAKLEDENITVAVQILCSERLWLTFQPNR